MAAASNPPGGTLHVVATPIGNLGDLSPRAREVLAAADVIAAEDTRRTQQLLNAMGISRPLQSLQSPLGSWRRVALLKIQQNQWPIL